MEGYIKNFDFQNMPAQKYYSAPNSWSPEKRKTEVQSRIFSGTWVGSRKMDGFLERFVKDEDGNMMLLSRSKSVKGDYPNKIEWVPQLDDFFSSLPKGTALLGELYIPNNEGSKNVTTILGCLKDKALQRQEEGNKLHYYVFDVLAYNNENLINSPMKERINYLDEVERLAYESGCEYVEVARYHRGKELWDALQEILAEGGEGIVITNEESTYKPDKRSIKDTFKCKKELTDTIDCFFTGRFSSPSRDYLGKEPIDWCYWFDLSTNEKVYGKLYDEWFAGKPIEPITKSYYYGFAGSLEIGVMKDGKICPIGWLSGLTEEIKKNPTDYAMRCVEVSAMELDNESNALRHGRLIQFRDDLTPVDCTYEKVFG